MVFLPQLIGDGLQTIEGVGELSLMGAPRGVLLGAGLEVDAIGLGGDQFDQSGRGELGIRDDAESDFRTLFTISADDAPNTDVDYCLQLDKFDFVMCVAREDGMLVARRQRIGNG